MPTSPTALTTNFAGQVNGFAAKVAETHQAVFLGIVDRCVTSIVEGSPLTGSPGQPVENTGPDKGNLRASWRTGLAGGTPGFNSPRFESPTSALIGTNCVYAESNEDGIARPGGGAYLLRANIGGRRSVELTRMGFQRIVDDAAATLGPDGPKPDGFQDNTVLGGSGS